MTQEGEGAEAAESAGLEYVRDDRPGIRRRRQGDGFRHFDPGGRPITDEATLRRLERLAIPPAWKDAWICTSPRGHLQATGRDGRGRKQYRYHPRWREVRDETKYDRMVLFARALPRIRARVRRHLRLPGLPHEKVLATVVRLLEESLIRVGNDHYARANGSIGLTTMRDRHVRVAGQTLRFRFRGKSGREHLLAVHDATAARVVRRLQDLPGQELFQYEDEEGGLRTIGSEDVNRYLREIAGLDVTAKDFRTWAATVLITRALAASGPARGRRARRPEREAINAVATQLGNTPAVCRKCYIHPGLLATYREGCLPPAQAATVRGLRTDEAGVLRMLEGTGLKRAG